MRGKIAIFIDGNNLFHAARAVGVEIDYAKLLNFLRGNSDLLRAFFYTGVDERAERQQGFLLWMRRNGYRVVEKELKTYADGTKKANLDVEIAVDMLSLADKYDTAVLVSGDEDFSYAINAVAYKGVRVELAGFRSNTSPRLIDVADQFIELDAHVDEITKADSRYSFHHNHSQNLHNNHHSGHLYTGSLPGEQSGQRGQSGNLGSAPLNHHTANQGANNGNAANPPASTTQPLSSDTLLRISNQTRETVSREVKSVQQNGEVRVVEASRQVKTESCEVRVDDKASELKAVEEPLPCEIEETLEDTIHDVGMKRLDGVLSRVIDE